MFLNFQFIYAGEIKSEGAQQIRSYVGELLSDRIITDQDLGPHGWAASHSLCENLPKKLVEPGYQQGCYKDGINPTEGCKKDCTNEDKKYFSLLKRECDESTLYGYRFPYSSKSIVQSNSDGQVTSYREVPITCIYQSMRKGVEVVKDVNYWSCPENLDNKGRPKLANDGLYDDKVSSNKSKPVCISEYYLRYTHWVINQGLNCVKSSIKKSPNETLEEKFFNAEEIFAIVNHESHFLHNVDKGHGNGLMQVMLAAAQDLEVKHKDENGNTVHHPGRKVWDDIRNEKNCRPFSNLFERFPIWTYEEKGIKKLYDCPYIDPENGIKRNVIAGLINLRVNIGIASSKIKSQWFLSPKDYEEAIRMAARIGYNRGYSVMRSALESVAKNPPGGKKLTTQAFVNRINQYLRKFNWQTAYYRKVSEDALDTERRSIDTISKEIELAVKRVLREPYQVKRLKEEDDSARNTYWAYFFAPKEGKSFKFGGAPINPLPDEVLDTLNTKLASLEYMQKKYNNDPAKLNEEYSATARQLRDLLYGQFETSPYTPLKQSSDPKHNTLDYQAEQFFASLKADNWESLKWAVNVRKVIAHARKEAAREFDKGLPDQIANLQGSGGFNCVP